MITTAVQNCIVPTSVAGTSSDWRYSLPDWEGLYLQISSQTFWNLLTWTYWTVAVVLRRKKYRVGRMASTCYFLFCWLRYIFFTWQRKLIKSQRDRDRQFTACPVWPYSILKLTFLIVSVSETLGTNLGHSVTALFVWPNYVISLRHRGSFPVTCQVLLYNWIKSWRHPCSVFEPFPSGVQHIGPCETL